MPFADGFQIGFIAFEISDGVIMNGICVGRLGWKRGEYVGCCGWKLGEYAYEPADASARGEGENGDYDSAHSFPIEEFGHALFLLMRKKRARLSARPRRCRVHPKGRERSGL